MEWVSRVAKVSTSTNVLAAFVDADETSALVKQKRARILRERKLNFVKKTLEVKAISYNKVSNNNKKNIFRTQYNSSKNTWHCFPGWYWL